MIELILFTLILVIGLVCNGSMVYVSIKHGIEFKEPLFFVFTAIFLMLFIWGIVLGIKTYGAVL